VSQDGDIGCSTVISECADVRRMGAARPVNGPSSALCVALVFREALRLHSSPQLKTYCRLNCVEFRLQFGRSGVRAQQREGCRRL
jgi:hypothetical protein